MRLVMFDVDGTLIRTRGAGMRAFYRALHQVFQVNMAEEVIRPDGKTDPLIAREMVAHFRMEDRWTQQTRDALFSAYLENLETDMSLAAARGALQVLPGVVDLLKTLTHNPEFAVGLATGNLEAGAQIKLRHAGLDGYFRFGGFGSDAEDRTELIRRGLFRGAQLCAPMPVEAAFVVGDTPLDIMHGHGADARVLAVASARYTVAELEPYQPEMLVPDLTAVADIMYFFNS
jgi:phosphoglycolate phosphatase